MINLTNEEIYKDYSKIVVGFSTDNEFKKLSSDKKESDGSY